MLENKIKKLFCSAVLCAVVCQQIAFPHFVSAATEEAVEKAGEAFVAANEMEGEGTEGGEPVEDEQSEESSQDGNEAVMEKENMDGASASNTENEVTEEELRQEIVDFALQFEGNPYVYGGTSLTNGADCSGFVMSVFAEFGYSLPRVAADQYYQSVKKSTAELQPGDLVFYGGGISHVALYIGDGQIIHASTSASGIKISNYDYETPVGVGTYIEAEGAEGFFAQ